MPEQVATAAIVIIGNEILSGKVKDENSHYLCRELRDLGVEVRSIVTIPDDTETIGTVVRQASEKYTWVFTSGGIGPTHDDLTVPSIAAGFQTPLVRSEKLAKLISGYYGKEVNEAHLRMAMIPEGSELLFDESKRVSQILFHNILTCFHDILISKNFRKVYKIHGFTSKRNFNLILRRDTFYLRFRGDINSSIDNIKGHDVHLIQIIITIFQNFNQFYSNSFKVRFT